MPLDQIEALRAMLLARRGRVATLDERRAGFEAQFGDPPLPDGVSTTPVTLGDSLSGLFIDAEGGARDRVLLWLHGGAFVLGSSYSYRHFGARAAQASGVRVLLLDYRLAPEHPFPAALDDTSAAISWLLDQGVAPGRIAVGGDSAGGNLALAALQRHAAAGGPALGAMWLMSPYLDLTHSGTSIAARAALDPFVDPEGMDGTAATYLADADPHDPAASPLFGPVDGLPPALIQVGSDEVLFDDARRLAERIEGVVFQQWVGMVHAWQMFAAMLDEGGWAIAQGGLFVRRQLL